MKSLFRKFTWWAQRRRKEDQLRDELRFHLEEEADERRAGGLPEDQAGWAARRDLGNVTLLREDTRTLWTWTPLEQLAQDLRYAVRTMFKNRAFTVLAALSLALGIGANTAIFSFMDAILVRSLPVPDPQSLVILSWHTPRPEFHGSDRHDDNYADPNGGFVGGNFAYPAFELLGKNESVFASVFGYQAAGKLNLAFRGQADLADTEYVSGEYFSGLGTLPAAGRLIAPRDDTAGSAAVAVISHALSQRRFGGPANAPGESILINNTPFTVIGVTTPEFFGADPDMPPDIYVPLHANLLLEPGNRSDPTARMYVDPDYDWVVPMARLRPGVTAAQAQAASSGPFLEWGRAAKPQVRAEDLPTLLVRDGARGLDGLRRTYSKPLYLLLTLVGLILTIACANIANLLLARAMARRREIAVRLSIGAGRFRVIRQLLTESVALSLLGGALGVAFAVWGIRFLTLLVANGRENFTLRADLNWNVLAVTAALSLVTGVLFGLAPALQSTRLDLLPALKASRTGEARGHGLRRLGLSRILMVAQIAITLLILVAAGLFLRTLSNLASIQPGFNSDVLTFRVNARQAGHTDPEIVAFYEELRQQFGALPGVLAATLSNNPLIGDGTSGTGIAVDGVVPRRGSSVLTVGPGFFATMQIPLVMGRDVSERDRPGAPMVAIVNQEFVRTRFGDRNPLGQHLGVPGECPGCVIEVVGVAANALYGNIKGRPRPTVYLPFGQGGYGPVRGMVYELRTTGNPLGYVAAVRDLVQRADPRLPVSEITTQRGRIDQTINQEITFARLCSAFALLALAIACVGLYGTMSYNVARRTGEIGIRMALGAHRGRVVWMVLREVFGLAVLGLAISLPIALATSGVLKSFLYQMEPNDTPSLALAVAVLLSAALAAGYAPARRASRINPITALRQE